ncbi:MAG TPA: chloride channel protein, partial [Candidatus Desulfofervidus auxilii]|nr:chloride channel protein [Candidatus Desulfofervidus auxilii]
MEIAQIRQTIVKFVTKIRLPEYVFLVLVAFIIGTFSALGSYLFLKGVEFLWEHCFLPVLTFCQSSFFNRIIIPFLPLTAAFLLFILTKLFSSQIYGYGFPTFLTNVNLRGGVIRIKDMLGRILGSLVTLGLGGSAGQEGPIAQIGGLTGAIISRFFVASEQRRRTFIACGSAGAIASVFNAPIAGVFFAQEIVLLG